MTATYNCIATTTLGSATNTVTFSTISNSFTDLILIVRGLASAECYVRMRFNGDTGNNYSGQYILGNGTSVSAQRYGSFSNIANAAVGPSAHIIQIQDYTNTNTFKTTLTRSNRANDYVFAGVGLWRNTNAITSITIFTDTNNYDAGTVFSLYGIKAE